MSYRNIHRVLAVIFFMICVSILYYGEQLGVWRGYIGDVIIVMFLYSLVQSIHIVPTIRALTGVLTLTYVIEILQFFHFIDFIHGSHSQALMLILGSVWDPIDLIAYTVGCVFIFLIDTLIRKRSW